MMLKSVVKIWLCFETQAYLELYSNAAENRYTDLTTLSVSADLRLSGSFSRHVEHRSWMQLLHVWFWLWELIKNRIQMTWGVWRVHTGSGGHRWSWTIQSFIGSESLDSRRVSSAPAVICAECGLSCWNKQGFPWKGGCTISSSPISEHLRLPAQLRVLSSTGILRLLCSCWVYQWWTRGWVQGTGRPIVDLGGPDISQILFLSWEKKRRRWRTTEANEKVPFTPSDLSQNHNKNTENEPHFLCFCLSGFIKWFKNKYLKINDFPCSPFNSIQFYWYNAIYWYNIMQFVVI